MATPMMSIGDPDHRYNASPRSRLFAVPADGAACGDDSRTHGRPMRPDHHSRKWIWMRAGPGSRRVWVSCLFAEFGDGLCPEEELVGAEVPHGGDAERGLEVLGIAVADALQGRDRAAASFSIGLVS